MTILEQGFAAVVFNAKYHAKRFEKASGWPRTASDEISDAITNLCTCLEASGASPEYINKIIDTHVIEHRNGTYSPRLRPSKKLVRFPFPRR